jgi:phosphoenolpyruvate carboxykinase (GTP)
MAMLPFIGYHAGDYFKHWLDIGRRGGSKMPRVFHVNWFRTDEHKKFLWPGFGDNIRVLEWILARIEGNGTGVETPLGVQPKPEELNVAGLGLKDGAVAELLAVRAGDWKEELSSQRDFLQSIGSKLPPEIWQEHEALRERLGL